MAVKYIESGGGDSGFLGALGTLATLGGMLIPGAGALTTLGAGLKAADSLTGGGSSGGGSSSSGVLGDITNVLGGLGDLASGNIADTNPVVKFFKKMLGIKDNSAFENAAHKMGNMIRTTAGVNNAISGVAPSISGAANRIGGSLMGGLM